MSYIVRPDSMEPWRIHQGVQALIVGEGQKMTGMISIWEPGAEFGAHTHPHEQMGIVTEGEIVFVIEGKDYPARAGDCYTIPSNVPDGERNDVKVRAVCMECFSPVRDDLVKRRKFEMPMVGD